MQRQHQTRERYLKQALAGVAADEIERLTTEAYREIFVRSDTAE